MQDTNNCEVEIKIFEFLQNIREEHSEFYEPVKRILKYIYKTVKKDYFGREIESLYQSGEKEKASKVDEMSKCIYAKYVECKGGILDNLIKMCNENPNYFPYFYKKIGYFFEMSDNGIYSDYGIYKYIYNLYTILKQYSLHPEDIDSFNEIVNDLSGLFITSIVDINKGASYGYGWRNKSAEEKKVIVDGLLSLGNYSQNSDIRNELKKVLDEINIYYEDSLKKQYEVMVDTLTQLEEDVQRLRDKGQFVPDDLLEQLKAEIKTPILNSKLMDLSYSEKKRTVGGDIALYTPIFLRKTRFDYFKTKLLEVEDSEVIRSDIFNYITKIELDFFDFLDQKTGTDSFITCMEIIFDSDTYHEMASKLDDLVRASQIYKEDIVPSLMLIEELKSDMHKEVIDGITMTWPENENSVNKIEKPTKIIDRMAKLHQTVEFAPTPSYYENRKDNYYYKLTLKSFSKRVLDEINGNKARHEAMLKKQQEEEAAKQQQEEPPKKPKGLGSIFTKKNSN